MLERGSGVLIHISSLPSGFGIGDLGPGAFDMADVLKAARQRYWQMLPVNPTDGIYGESPYSSPSAFAGNPLFISPQALADIHLLSAAELAPQDFHDEHVDFSQIRPYKEGLCRRAFKKFSSQGALSPEYRAFCEGEDFWLRDYALFMTLKKVYPESRWDEWPAKFVARRPDALAEIEKAHAEEMAYVYFQQFMFHQQWKALRAYCRGLGILLIGDMPIYVNDDSADVWAHQGFFRLGPDHRPEVVAGVPPDYFSTSGQRWGNPVYRWDVLKNEGYRWWIKRLQRQFELFDVVRIDHFRGFESFWAIPASEATAVRGEWVDGPREDFLRVLSRECAGKPIIAEDLGIITPQVTALMDQFSIPGMKVLQFAFGGETATHPYIPENYTERCVVYTGTHDNNTSRGWFEHDASGEEKENFRRYLNDEVQPETVAGQLIELAEGSRAVLAVIPLQDVMGLGAEARMNTPGTAHGNWRWRCRRAQVGEERLEWLADLTRAARRG